MSKWKLFLVSFAVTTISMLVYFYATRPFDAAPQAEPAPTLVQTGEHLYVSSQLKPSVLGELSSHGIRNIVDVRPDGEADDESPSWEIKKRAEFFDMDFHYIPVPHDSIPEDAVSSLSGVLAHAPGPTVLYCRTGRRAVRLLALAEASRFDGPTSEAIIAMVRRTGFTAEDLAGNIAQRIAHRSQPQPVKE